MFHVVVCYTICTTNLCVMTAKYMTKKVHFGVNINNRQLQNISVHKETKTNLSGVVTRLSESIWQLLILRGNY